VTKHILFNGQPKAGNHLLFRIPEIFDYGYPYEFKSWDKTLKGGDYMFWHQHLPWSKSSERVIKERDVKMVIIYRDPRDVLASFVRAIIDHQENVAEYWTLFQDLGMEQFINEVMFGKNGKISKDAVSMVDYRMKWLTWKTIDCVLPVRFENLVGSKGNGNDAAQLKSFIRICQFIGFKKEDSVYKEAVKKIYSPESNTFVKGGKIGAWKNILTESNLIQLKKIVGNLIEELGYG